MNKKILKSWFKLSGKRRNNGRHQVRNHQKIGALSKSDKGWAKELNLISWNDREPRYDIREWSPDGKTMGKGVTLSKEELAALSELLNKMGM